MADKVGQWKKFLESPLVTSIGIILATIGVTYAFIDSVFIDRYKYDNEKLKDEINDYRYIIKEQGETIEKKDDKIEKLYNFIEEYKNNSKPSAPKSNIQAQAPKSKNVILIEKLIIEGRQIEKMKAGDDKTYSSYTEWRNKSISLIASVDKELKSSFSEKFANLTEINLSGYQEIPSKTADGIVILSTVKGKIYQ